MKKLPWLNYVLLVAVLAGVIVAGMRFDTSIQAIPYGGSAHDTLMETAR